MRLIERGESSFLSHPHTWGAHANTAKACRVEFCTAVEPDHRRQQMVSLMHIVDADTKCWSIERIRKRKKGVRAAAR